MMNGTNRVPCSRLREHECTIKSRHGRYSVAINNYEETMQFRLSTLLLIFFNVVASLVLFGVWGLWASMLLFSAAICLNRANTLRSGIFYAVIIVFIELIITGMLMPAESVSREAAKRAQCMNNLKQIGNALHNYNEAKGHFPLANTIDQNGNPLLSWRAEILQMLEYGKLYNAIKKDEPWNSPYNVKLLGQFSIKQYYCPSDVREKDDFTTNYIAIIGPETAWREKGSVKFSDLPDGGSHTVMLVEVANSGVHWAEPRDITVEEALKRMKTGQGLGISSVHPSVINVLFADGSVQCLRKDMPISMWKKLFAGEIKDIYGMEDDINESATDIPDFSFTQRERPLLIIKIWAYIFIFFVWIFSVVLIFHRAIKSRRKLVIAT
jgi:prepilin-type processing-associated H-X9-DG protein